MAQPVAGTVSPFDISKYITSPNAAVPAAATPSNYTAPAAPTSFAAGLFGPGSTLGNAASSVSDLASRAYAPAAASDQRAQAYAGQGNYLEAAGAGLTAGGQAIAGTAGLAAGAALNPLYQFGKGIGRFANGALGLDAGTTPTVPPGGAAAKMAPVSVYGQTYDPATGPTSQQAAAILAGQNQRLGPVAAPVASVAAPYALPDGRTTYNYAGQANTPIVTDLATGGVARRDAPGTVAAQPDIVRGAANSPAARAGSLAAQGNGDGAGAPGGVLSGALSRVPMFQLPGVLGAIKEAYGIGDGAPTRALSADYQKTIDANDAKINDQKSTAAQRDAAIKGTRALLERQVYKPGGALLSMPGASE